MHILVIDDHPLFREVLSEHINDFYPSAIIFETGSVEEALGLMQYKQFDLITLDLFLSGQGGMHGFPLLREEMPDAAIVVVSGSGDSTLAQSIIDQGANGYIDKSTGIREIKNALSLILSGETYISPCMLVEISPSPVLTNKDHSKALSRLTPRQREVDGERLA